MPNLRDLTCGCRIELAESGEPLGFVARCPQHPQGTRVAQSAVGRKYEYGGITFVVLSHITESLVLACRHDDVLPAEVVLVNLAESKEVV